MPKTARILAAFQVNHENSTLTRKSLEILLWNKSFHRRNALIFLFRTFKKTMSNASLLLHNLLHRPPRRVYKEYTSLLPNKRARKKMMVSNRNRNSPFLRRGNHPFSGMKISGPPPPKSASRFARIFAASCSLENWRSGQIAGKITILNRRYSFIHGWFFHLSCYFSEVYLIPMWVAWTTDFHTVINPPVVNWEDYSNPLQFSSPTDWEVLGRVSEGSSVAWAVDISSTVCIQGGATCLSSTVVDCRLPSWSSFTVTGKNHLGPIRK